MRQSNSDSLLAATNADDILRFLALGKLKSCNVNTQAQPNLNVVELYKWMPDNELRFMPEGNDTKIEQAPIYAMVDKKVGVSHFCFESFRLLRDCFDAGGYVVDVIPKSGPQSEPPPDLGIMQYYASLDYLTFNVSDKATGTTVWLPKGENTSTENLPDSLPRLTDLVSHLDGVLRPFNRQKYVREIQLLKGQLPKRRHIDANAISDDSLLAIGVPEMSRQIESLHQFWVICRERKPELKHPLSAIVGAWLNDWIIQEDAKPITLEFDKRRPVAILKRESMGSIRDLVFTRDEGGPVSSELLTRPAPKEEQLSFLPRDAEESKLPKILPFELYQQGAATTKSAAVAMPVRLAFEALIQMEPGTHSERLYWQLGDLIDYLNPDGKFNWTNQVGYILDGLSGLYYLRFPYTPTGEGEVDWIPFMPRAVPNQNSTRDSRIIIEVSLPLDISAHGMLVEKNVVRLLGKKSSARFNAYLTACWLFDRYGTVNGNIIDPTIPKERRNDRGELVDANGKPIVTSHGKPVKNVKNAEAARQLERTTNPAKDKYPLLDNYDLIRACYPKGVRREHRREYLRRAKKAWTELETTGFIRIERSESGWRIMPSEQHVSHYRALQSGHKQ